MSATVKPRRIRLEASTLCQLSCPSCPNAGGIIDGTLGRGYLRLADFADLLRHNPALTEIELSNCGEIFLNPDLLPILELAHARGVTLRADSGANLNRVSREQLAGLVRYRLRSMTCSIDGASESTYQAYRVGGNLATVLANVATINALKREQRSRYPRLTWQFVVFGHNEAEIPAARRLAAGLNMTFQLKTAWPDGFSPVRNGERVRREHWLSASSRAMRATADPDRGMSIFCHHLWEQPQINWDGRILGCCCNHWADFRANAFADGLVDSVNSEPIRYARAMLQGRRPERDDIPCTRCSAYQAMKADGRWLRRGMSRWLSRQARAAYREWGVRRLEQRLRAGMAARSG